MRTDTGTPLRSLRVMTFNIRHGAGIFGRVDLHRTVRLIRDARVDVAAL